jgi:ubiquinone/menaquinone biosynthesis C-methylase UbiE
MESMDLGEGSHTQVIDRLLEVRGEALVDVGCGDGGFARALAERGADVLALEPDPVQAERNRKAAEYPGVRFVEAGGEKIPAETDSKDGVLFNRSLHHVPGNLMDRAIEEAARVVRPTSGYLYVIEPDMAGAWSQLMKPFHDETEVRRHALECLDRTAAPLFAEAREYWYLTWMRFASFEEFVAKQLAVTYRGSGSALGSDDVRRVFDTGRHGDGFRFAHPMRLRVYRAKRTA